MGEHRLTKKQGKFKKALRQGVSTVVRIATMGQAQSRDLQPLAKYGGINVSAPPLRFHPTHGDNIRLEEEGFRARRVESFCHGVLFSDRPVAIGERVYLKIVDLSTRWNGVIRVGFSAHNPAHLGRLPKYACPDLTSMPGYWAKAMSERYSAEANVLIHFSISGNGDVHFGINGKDRGVFFSGVDTRRPLWALIDLYGNCTAIDLVDMRRNLNNVSPQRTGENVVAISSTWEDRHIQALNDQLSVMGVVHGQHATLSEPAPPPMVRSQTLPRPAARPAMDHGGAQRLQVELPTPSSHTQPRPAGDVLPLQHNHDVAFRPLAFHFCTGRNVSLSTNSMVASRHDEEFAQGYVFTSSPIRLAERLVIQVLNTEESYIGSLAFGLTNCDPTTIDTRELPEDSDLLLDRREFWVVSKDVANSPNIGDELSFTVRPDGAVEFSRNGSAPSVFMHVDASLRLWAFWDIYGHTSKIRILGGTNVPVLTPAVATNPAPITHEASGSGMMEQPSECIVCLERSIDCVIYSCGHMCMCHGCAIQQWKGQGGGFCPICRESIRDVIKTFRS